MNIARRHGTPPTERCTGANSCPDILELDTGDYLIIGRTAHADPKLLTRHGASIGVGETAVIVPADVMRAAVLDIAAEAFTQPLQERARPA